jgi:hypothetical protein
MAWKSKRGFLQDDGLFVDMYMVKQSHRVPARRLGFTAWQVSFL